MSYKINKISCLGFCLILVGCGKSDESRVPDSYIVCHAVNPAFTRAVATSLITKWRQSLQKYNQKTTDNTWSSAANFVADNYDNAAVLLPTVNPIIRVGAQQIYNYFVPFLAEDPVMSLVSNEIIKYGCGFGLADGYYDFTLYPNNPESTVKVHARYMFAYTYRPTKQIINILIEGGVESGVTKQLVQPAGWYIDVQHSSIVPTQSR